MVSKQIIKFKYIYLKKRKKNWKFTLKYILDINCKSKLEVTNLIERKKEVVPAVTTSKAKEEKYILEFFNI